MNKFIKQLVLAAGVFAMTCLTDFPEAMFSISFVPEAEAVVVVRRGAPVVATVVVVAVASSSAQKNAAANANANAAAAQANQAAAQANQAAAQASKAATDAKAPSAQAQQPPPSPPAVGTIVTTLPSGCTQTKLNNVDYMRCGSTYYKPAMVGDKVVFVVEQP